jgi:hypothetical protein
MVPICDIEFERIGTHRRIPSNRSAPFAGGEAAP